MCIRDRSYSVIVTDAHNCQVNLNTFISNIGGPTLSLLNVNPVSCFGGSNGDATIAVLQGTSPYTCLLYTSPSPRDRTRFRMPPSA